MTRSKTPPSPSPASQVQSLLHTHGMQMDFLLPLTKAPETKRNTEHIRDYCTAQAQMVLGDIRATQQDTLNDIVKRRTHHDAKMAEQQKRVDRTDTMIAKRDVVKQECTDANDLFMLTILNMSLAAICVALAFTALLIGAGNIYSIIMASGQPVFLDDPALAVALSAILPIGAFALEFFKRQFSTDKAKRRYMMTVYALCAVLLIAWIILFAMVFGSAADQSIDLSSMMSDSNHETDYLPQAFTIIQLLAELFVGAALFMTGGELFAKHMRSIRVANPDYERAKAVLDAMQREIDTFYAPKQREAQGWLDAIDNGTRIYVADHIALYQQLRAQCG